VLEWIHRQKQKKEETEKMNTELLKQSLNDVEVGHIVVRSKGGYYTTPKVTKVTKTQITIEDGTRFSKDTGREVGGSKWHSAHIYAPLATLYGSTDTTWIESYFAQRDARRVAREALIEKIEAINLSTISTEKLERVLVMLKG